MLITSEVHCKNNVHLLPVKCGIY